MNSSVARDTAVVLFGHGARNPDWAGPMRRIREALLARPDAPSVELAFLEFMTPTLPEAVAALTAAGARKVAVVPIFLAQAGHLTRDLPILVDEVRAAHPDCEIVLATAAGESARVVAAMADYAASCLD
ncbi:sirohydrochlorin chelatase [Thauera mechernichensis]|mgnify:CR=1 FL=1|uniref:Sirohydrochlorin chelatase n=1 Tax=Thauera mechernichensis TaxID=82788 RepID=A0ABW3WGF1_9RHOO|nr:MULTISPECIES: CbiX/SirB N-terminal domain-containing protein [Thauera]ENO77266.1 cobalamin (vitamin B12) biosynthesis CbiX protein [Thauera sp. 27]MDG3063390.1 CbiX/SirB N-terminal domain-containing protein [Thauera mechernichensis]WBL63377.1 CbiX/SirB N-terminal domain-containing protein [Thauera sp. WB-2]HNR60611.1 CbiX/SirB N-terminal domain-containing protein [Thauera sp.]HNS92391.1 CbiX/SirB N-terminal domain-containing protein [Thauera sp.]